MAHDKYTDFFSQFFEKSVGGLENLPTFASETI